ncbi:MAG: hypothetical protein AAGI24_04060 [Pseudomonadota bacterium]
MAEAKKNWYVESPVRLGGKLYPVGSKLSASASEVQGIAHCLSDRKAPDADTIARQQAEQAASEQAAAEKAEAIASAETALAEAVAGKDKKAIDVAAEALSALVEKPAAELIKTAQDAAKS